MNKKTKINLIFIRAFFALFFLAVPAFLQASTAGEIETLLNSKTISYAQASRFVLEAAGVFVTANNEEAFNYAVQQNWLPENTASGDTARLDHVSLLIMGSFDIKGGIMYSFFRNSHYAYRELAYLNIIQSRSDPMMLVSGENLLLYINRILTQQEAQVLAANRRAENTVLE
ncbi:MAG: hypothetical protein FWD14_05630 [Treponema sp.]|nr:hypothetical protein [Treponema sp.]